jgi:hypothetical protein
MKRQFRFAFEFAWPRLAYGTIVAPGRYKTPRGRALFDPKKRRAGVCSRWIKIFKSRQIGD